MDGDGGYDGFGDGFGGHDSHDAYGNPDFDGPGEQSYEALAIAFDHSQNGGDGDGSFDNDAAVAASFGHFSHADLGHAYHGDDDGAGHVSHALRTGAAHSANGGDGTERRLYVLKVVGHSWVSIHSELERIVGKYDVIPVEPFRRPMDSSDVTVDELADNDPFTFPYQVEDNPPGGWYPGATGTTRLIRQVWQVGKRKKQIDRVLAFGLKKLNRHEWCAKPQYDKDGKTYLDMSVASWHYGETNDHTTLVVIRIVSTAIWSARAGRYGYKVEPFLEHQAAAEAIMQDLLAVLKAAVPSESSRSLRQFWTGTGGDSGDIPAGEPTVHHHSVDELVKLSRITYR